MTTVMIKGIGECVISKVLGKCFICGNKTKFVEINYEGFLCSEKCNLRASDEMNGGYW